MPAKPAVIGYWSPQVETWGYKSEEHLSEVEGLKVIIWGIEEFLLILHMQFK